MFYKDLPKKTLHVKDDKYTGGKHSKIKVTGLAATNINGDKLRMFVIGKSKKLDASNVKKLPCRYRGQNKSWMDSTLFENWVRWLNNHFEKKTGKLHSSLIIAQPIQILED